MEYEPLNFNTSLGEEAPAPDEARGGIMRLRSRAIRPSPITTAAAAPSANSEVATKFFLEKSPN